MITFSTKPYFIVFQRFECYTTLIVKKLLYNNKIKFFTFILNSVVTYIAIAATSISNNITKQYYRITVSLLDKEAFFDIKNIFMISINVFKGGIPICFLDLTLKCLSVSVWFKTKARFGFCHQFLLKL